MAAPVREYVATLGALLLGGVVLLVGYGATWAVVTIPVFSGDEGPVSEVVLSGRDIAPIGAAAGWIALAGLAGLLATRTWGRRAIGAIVAIAGGAAGATALAYGLAGDASASSMSGLLEAALAARSLGGLTPTSVAISGWWIVAAGGALATMVAGFLALVRGPGWPRLSGRYERSAPAPQRPEGEVRGIAAWDALDRGEDPTDPDARAG